MILTGSLRMRLLTSILMITCVSLGYSALGTSQVLNDPSGDQIPTVDLETSEKAVVVELQFSDPGSVDLQAIHVVFGKARRHVGDPPLLFVDLLDLAEISLRQFNAWHPQWLFAEDDTGQERLIVQPKGRGAITFPLIPNVATMRVTDVAKQQEVIAVDLIPVVHGFCRDNPNDTDCDDVANRPPACDANGPYTAECAGSTTNVILDATSSSDPDGDPLSYAWSGSFGAVDGPSPTVQFQGLGNSTVNLNVSDGFGGTEVCDANVAIVDTALPVIDEITATPDLIWPPNHKLIPVTVNISVSDGCDISPRCRIVAVDVDDHGAIWSIPINKPNYVITGPNTVELMAERRGRPGRTYTIDVECVDAAGNTVSGSTEVIVPHNERRIRSPVLEGLEPG